MLRVKGPRGPCSSGELTCGRRSDKALEKFQTDEKCKVFLISLKAGGCPPEQLRAFKGVDLSLTGPAGGTGLNLTAANKVYMLDPWWNPATEDQAVDRVHRLGQEKPVEVVRFICNRTLEEKICASRALCVGAQSGL